jgi:hypothetical protein
MLYYIITAELALELGLTAYRHGNNKNGYLVNRGDLVMCNIEEEISKGRITEVSAGQARNFIKNM